MPSYRRFVSFVILLLFVALALEANWRSDYAKGKRLYRRGSYGMALIHFQKALKKKPVDCHNCIREGMHFDDYIPNYYVAECLFQKGKKEEALVFMKKALRMGVVEKKPGFFANLKKQMAQIETKEAGSKQPTQAPVVAAEKPKPSTKAPDKLAGMKASIQDRLDQVKLKVDAARGKVRNNPGLRKIVGKVDGEILRLQGRINHAESQEELLNVDRELTALVVKMQELKRALAKPPPSQDHRPAPRPGKPAPRPSQVPEGPRGIEQIQSGFSAYFQGDLEKAMEFALKAEGAGSRSCYLPLLRGVILSTRYYLEDESDAALLKRAREAFRRARRGGCGGNSLPSGEFSPRIFKIYREINP